jgi:hypothetical protein
MTKVGKVTLKRRNMIGRAHFKKLICRKLNHRGKCSKHLLLSRILRIPKKKLGGKYSEKGMFLNRNKVLLSIQGATLRFNLKFKES